MEEILKTLFSHFVSHCISPKARLVLTQCDFQQFDGQNIKFFIVDILYHQSSVRYILISRHELWPYVRTRL